MKRTIPPCALSVGLNSRHTSFGRVRINASARSAPSSLLLLGQPAPSAAIRLRKSSVYLSDNDEVDCANDGLLVARQLFFHTEERLLRARVPENAGRLSSKVVPTFG